MCFFIYRTNKREKCFTDYYLACCRSEEKLNVSGEVQYRYYVTLQRDNFALRTEEKHTRTASTAGCETRSPTYVDFCWVIAVDLLFLFNILTVHLSTASDKKTISAGQVNLSCVRVCYSFHCSLCERLVRQVRPHTPFSISEFLRP